MSRPARACASRSGELTATARTRSLANHTGSAADALSPGPLRAPSRPRPSAPEAGKKTVSNAWIASRSGSCILRLQVETGGGPTLTYPISRRSKLRAAEGCKTERAGALVPRIASASKAAAPQLLFSRMPALTAYPHGQASAVTSKSHAWWAGQERKPVCPPPELLARISRQLAATASAPPLRVAPSLAPSRCAKRPAAWLPWCDSLDTVRGRR